MIALKFNKNSWHYKLADMGGYDSSSSRDICTYTRRILLGAMLFAFVSCIGLFLTYVIINMLFAVGFSLWYGMWIISDIGFAGWLLTFIGAAAFGIVRTFEAIGRWRAKRREEKYNREPEPDGYVLSAYKGWKDKYCAKLEFVNATEEENSTY